MRDNYEVLAELEASRLEPDDEHEEEPEDEPDWETLAEIRDELRDLRDE